MKLIIQIPCFNEEGQLADTLADLPRSIEGVDSIEVLIIDDGSTDKTVEVARENGVTFVVRHLCNQGLAQAFRTGVDACLSLGADIIVNTDADNQYVGADIAKLVQPIVRGEAEIVIGDRRTQNVEHFSFAKKRLQWLGSLVVRQFSGTDVPDAVSGFRAMSKDAARRINIGSSFSYTIEMLIQAGAKRMAIAAVPVGVNLKTRESRLFPDIPTFIKRSVATLLRSYAMYQPFRVFFLIGLFLLFVGSLPILRFLTFYLQGDTGGHIQSLVLGGALVVIGVMSLLIGLIADLIAFNRKLLETILERVRRLEQGDLHRSTLERVRRSDPDENVERISP